MKLHTVTTRIYGRFSSKPQERGDSRRQQVEGAIDYAKRNGLAETLSPEIYFDEAVSGKAGLNLEKEFGRLINDSNEGDNILVMYSDRIGRQNPFLTGKLIYDITQKGVNVIVWGEGKIIDRNNINELGTQMGVFTGNAISHGDNQRRITRANLINADTLKKASEGLPTRNLLKYLPSCYYWNESKQCFEYNKDKAEIIVKIFELYISGNGTTSICKELNRNNTPCLYSWNKDKKWREVTIKQILRNESYSGVCVPRKNPEMKITCFPHIVSKEIFDKAQLLLQRYKNRHGNTSIHTRTNNIFPKLVKCSVCQGNLTVSMTNTKDGRKRPSYQYNCINHKYDKCTVKQRRSVRPFEVLIMSAFAGGDGSNMTDRGNSQIQGIEKRINEINKAMENLYDLAEQGDNMAIERIGKRKQELLKLEGELRLLIAENRDFATMPSLIEEIASIFGNKNDDENTRLVKGNEAMKNFFYTTWQRLQNNELRRKLYNITPSLIDNIQVDLINNRYNVVKKGEILNNDNWVNVSKIVNDIKSCGFKWDERIHHKPRRKKET
jgi:DNA invertase Pin-like site-specific DNA recombinase